MAEKPTLALKKPSDRRTLFRWRGFRRRVGLHTPKSLALPTLVAVMLTAPAFSYPKSVLDKLQWIESRTGYRVDYQDLPSVHFVNPSVMAALPIAQRADVSDTIFGAFRPQDNKILIDQRLLAPRHQDYAATVLVHELVHFVQHQNGALARNCSIELEAYTVQRQFAKEHGLETKHINVANGRAFKQNCEKQQRVLEDTIRKLRTNHRVLSHSGKKPIGSLGPN